MIPDIPQHKKQEQRALAAARRKYQRTGGKITRLPGVGAQGKDLPTWNGRDSRELSGITRARNNGLKKMQAAAAEHRRISAAVKKRNQQVLRTEWTELNEDDAA